MKAPRSNSFWPWLAALTTLTASGEALAQWRYAQPEVEPQWLRLNIRDANFGISAEGEHNTVSAAGLGGTSTHDRLFVGPSLGLNLDGSIYHPKLLQYSLESDNVFGWEDDHIKLPGATQDRREFDYLGRFSARAEILPGKPYHGTLFGGYSHDFRDYDFFSRAVVDSLNYGARAGWNLQPFTLGANYYHLDEDISTLSGLSSSHQDSFAFDVGHARAGGQTSLNACYSEYSRVDYNVPGRGSSYSAALADNEQFGSRQQCRLDTTVNYLSQNYISQPNDQITAQANLMVEHRPELHSSYNLTFDRYTTGSFVSDNVTGQAQAQHRLFESLTSTVLVRGSDYEGSDPFSSGYTRRYGVGWTEFYTKALSPVARLTINNSLLADHVDQQNLSFVRNEPHTFGSGGAPPDTFFLSLPSVDWASIEVWKADRSQRYLLGIDYDLFLNGTITQIQRHTGSLMDASVVVDYAVDPTPAGQYDILSETFGVRLGLWKNRWGLYVRGNLSWNDALAAMRIPGLANYVFGTDYTWRWLRAGAEYSIYDSTLARYTMARLFESANVRLDDATSGGLDFSQSWLNYQDSNRQEQDYRFTAYIHRALARNLRLNVQGGYDLRIGQGVDQQLATFRLDLDYNIGRTSIKAGYDYEHDLFLNTEIRERHLFTFRLRRNF